MVDGADPGRVTHEHTALERARNERVGLAGAGEGLSARVARRRQQEWNLPRVARLCRRERDEAAVTQRDRSLGAHGCAA